MSDCLLIDDSPLNVSKAKAVGWRALFFSDPATLQRNISSLLHRRNIISVREPKLRLPLCDLK